MSEEGVMAGGDGISWQQGRLGFMSTEPWAAEPAAKRLRLIAKDSRRKQAWSYQLELFGWDDLDEGAVKLPQKRSLHPGKLTQRERRSWKRLHPGWDKDRPKTREDCRGGYRPCPYVSCKHHLFLEIDQEVGSIRMNFPGKEPWELEDSCSLDVAERLGDDDPTGIAGLLALYYAATTERGHAAGLQLEEVGKRLGLTLERARQLQAIALQEVGVKIRRAETPRANFVPVGALTMTRRAG